MNTASFQGLPLPYDRHVGITKRFVPRRPGGGQGDVSVSRAVAALALPFAQRRVQLGGQQAERGLQQ